MRFAQIRRRLQQRRDDAGFSIVEMAVATAVFSIVMTVIFGTVINVVNASNTFKERTQQQAETRLAVDTLVRDLRQAYTGKSTLASVEVSGIATITFYSPDRATDFHLRKITYTLPVGSTILSRSVTTSINAASGVVGLSAAWNFTGAPTATAPVLTGVTNTTLFLYKNQLNGTPTTSYPLRAIQIDLLIDQSPTTSPTPQTYHTQVDLRVTDNDGS
jgi:prepilin-type N-terminal cleavage/methylation domain-containing protein